MNITTAEDKFNFAVWDFLDRIKEKLLPDKAEGIIELSINRDISLNDEKNPLTQDKVIQYLIKENVIQTIGEPIIQELGKSGTSKYQLFEGHRIKVLKKFERFYKRYLRLFKKENSSNELKFGNLKLNLEKATLQYKNNPKIIMSPKAKEIQFLVLLLKNKGTVVKYRDIAKQLDVRFYRDSKQDNEVARDVQFVRRDLGKILKKTGMTNKDIEQMIIALTNLGYKAQK